MSGPSAFSLSIQVSIPAVPPAFSPYLSRSASRIGPREGYFSLVSALPLWSTASIDGADASPVFSDAPAVSCGWITVGAQSTSGRPVVRPRTTVSSEEYDQGLDFPSNDTVAFTV